MKLGAHISIAGGHQNALTRGKDIGCTAIQIFTKNANQWAAKPVSPEDAELFKTTRSEVSYQPADLIAHDSYLINLASPDDALWKKSILAFGHELDRCALLEVPALVTHAGAHMGAGEDAGLERIAAALEQALSERPGQDVMVLLETTAGQGTHLAKILELVGPEVRPRIGVCWDTCHLFASGIDFSDAEKYGRMVEDFDRTVGLDRLRAIHLNDSQKSLGSRVDRYEHIGKGALGLEPFRLIMNDPNLAHLPKVLETPKGPDYAEDIENMAVLRSLINSSEF